MNQFDPTRKRGTLRPSKPKRKQKLKKQPTRKPLGRRKGRLRSQTAPARLILRPTSRQPEMPSTATARRFRTNFGGVIRSVTSFRDFLASARLYSLMLLVGCLYALYTIGTNPRFYLNNVVIDGASALRAADILRVSGLQGAHIFAIEPDSAAEKISAIAGVVSAEVRINWPDDVQIMIEEDAPVLYWREAGRDYWVTENGTLIETTDTSLDLVRVRAVVPPSVQPLTLAESPELNDDPVVPTYLDFIPPEIIEGANALREYYPTITEFEYAPSGGLRFQDERGWMAKYGTGEELVRKHAIYETIAEHVQGEAITVEYINVSVVDNPVYKPISGVSSE